MYSVCATRDNTECISLDKETRQRKSLWKEPNDESSTDESLDESSISMSISIKNEIRSKQYRT